MANQRDGEMNPVDATGLCLLSLDGGGVRGLSTLFILKRLMEQLSRERQGSSQQLFKPCEAFDLIGGTGTGGLIAIMLSRLEMDVNECILSYNKIMKAVFGKKQPHSSFKWTSKIQPRFDSETLKSAVEEMLKDKGISKVERFNNENNQRCKVFVCATAQETSSITLLRSYELLSKPNFSATICEAALATSATSFFDPVTIGARQFVEGALGANNPVEEVEGEAANIWCEETGDLKPLVKCFISIGTGNPGKKAINDNMLGFLSDTLVRMVTETERTEKKFIARWAQHFDEKRYFRFNVEQGLQDVALVEYKEQGKIEAATDEYLIHQSQKFRVRDCVIA
ncbi:FabD/lysophospholipase-like protein [Ascodesmis nigricans]|uniref:FabD/lysophospholipase-like protein n=1 Tax=Ascodesmis nigricans TaxID=341454 RepID=A0A4V3SHU4_9PEZI|nr:FabD/lysophospholipase-like protein [Ascodesmis nigricans]